ncbi:MAG: 30S ribosomal protein S25e [Fervidicoccaceae archaeon]
MPKQKKEEKQQSSARSLVQQAEMNVSVPTDLLKRAEREVKGMDYITPFSLAQKLSVSISTARKILKMLEESKAVEIVSRNRRSPVYAPKK